METEWVRIPAAIDSEKDRREMCGILASCGLEVRVVRVRTAPRSSSKRHIEYRQPAVQIFTEAAVD